MDAVPHCMVTSAAEIVALSEFASETRGTTRGRGIADEGGSRPRAEEDGRRL